MNFGYYFEVLRELTDPIERRLLSAELCRQNGNQKAAARSLGMSYRALLYKMDQLGLKRRRKMTVTMSFSGGATHSQEVPPELQQKVADMLANKVKDALEACCIGGYGSIAVGDKGSSSISATATKSVEEVFAEQPAPPAP